MDSPHPRPDRFRWPPGPSEPRAPRAPVPAPSVARGPARLADLAAAWWSAIEDGWLGRTLAPLPKRAADAAWTPDAPGTYCPRCGRGVDLLEAVVYEGPAFGCPRCRGSEVPWARLVRLGAHEGLLRDSIHILKFSPLWREGVTLGGWLGQAVADQLREGGVDPSRACLVPIPTTFRRRVRRGIDHTDALVRGARGSSGLAIVRALARRHRPSQVHVPASQRRRNVHGTMRLVGPVPPVVVLVDDVVTTGATMREACRAMLEGCRRAGLEPLALWVATCAVAGEGRTDSATKGGSP